MFSHFFGPKHGWILVGFIFGALAFSAALIAGLQILPQSARRNLIRAVTFLGGLFYAVEFFWPIHVMPTPDDPTQRGNFLTPYIVPLGNFALVVAGWTVGLGLLNLIQIHGKRLAKGGSNAVNSFAFFVSMIAMMVIGILQEWHPNAINKNLNDILFNGGLQNLDATMFSIIAFYIVSAAYRAFRVRSIEATLLLVTAILVMLGQISIGFMMTNWLPHNIAHHNIWSNLWSNFRVEVIRDWLLNKASVPAVRAINFGLAVGALAIALRIWLGLERGSYFEKQA